MKKKIVIFYDFLKELGGLERVMFFQANELSKKYDVELLFSFISEKEKKNICEELELNENIPLKTISNGKFELLEYLKNFIFFNRIKKINADLVISHSFMSTQMAYKKNFDDSTKYLVMIHHPPNFLYSKINGWANNPARFFANLLGKIVNKRLKEKDIIAVKNSSLIFSNSKYTKKRVFEIYKKNSTIMYPQISSFFKIISKSDKKIFLKNKGINKKFVFAHGRIIPDKNYKSIIRMLRRIPVNLIISGSVSKGYKEEILSEIKKFGMEDRVMILGRISKEDLLGYYNCAELFLMPAKKEDFGLTVVEAISCGCPVISWKDGTGPNEIIHFNENGLLAKPYSNNDFESKIKEGLKKNWDSYKVAKTVKQFESREVSKKLLLEIDSLLSK